MSAPHTNAAAPHAADSELPNVSAFLATGLPRGFCLPSLSPAALNSFLTSTVDQLTEAFLADISNYLEGPHQQVSVETLEPTHDLTSSHESEPILLPNYRYPSESHSESTLTDPLVHTDADAQSRIPALPPAQPPVIINHDKSSRGAPNHSKVDTSKPQKQTAKTLTESSATLSDSLRCYASFHPPQVETSSHHKYETAKGKRSTSCSAVKGKDRKRKARDPPDQPRKTPRSANTATVSDPRSEVVTSGEPAPRLDFEAAKGHISLVASSVHTSQSLPEGRASPVGQFAATVTSRPGVRIARPPPKPHMLPFN